MSEIAEDSLKTLTNENLSNEQKYSILMMVAAACKQLYGGESSKITISRRLILSLIEDLNIPRQVTNGILTSFQDTDIESSMQPYRDSLLKDSAESNQTLPFELIQLLLTATLKSEAVYGYDAHVRVVLLHVANSLGLKQSDFLVIENSLIKFLKSHAQSTQENEESKKRSKMKSVRRGVIIGLTAISGGALIGLTGGLAAPLIAAGATTIFGTSAAILGTGVGTAILGSLFGVAGAGLSGFKMKNRIGSVRVFEFLPLSETKQLHAVIAISGYLKKDENDFFLPWSQLNISKEQYTLKWETNELLQMGCAIDYFISAAKSAVVTETLKFTALSGLMTAIAWPASLLSIASVLDNPWSVCLNRADDGGIILADVIISRQHGCRPVTLIGFSSGARLIYSCLKELSKRKSSDGIIQDVYIFGGPVTSEFHKWEDVLPVIAGRILNGYCKKDWILKFLFRFSQGTSSLAGLMPINSKSNRIQNFDLTEIINGHGDYYQNMTAIFEAVGIPTRENMIASTMNIDTKSTTDSGVEYCEDLIDHHLMKENIVQSTDSTPNIKLDLSHSIDDCKTSENKNSLIVVERPCSGVDDDLIVVHSAKDVASIIQSPDPTQNLNLGISHSNDVNNDKNKNDLGEPISSLQNITDGGSVSSYASVHPNVKMSDFILSKSHFSSDMTSDSANSQETHIDDQYKRDSKLYHVLKPIKSERKLSSLSFDNSQRSYSEPISPIHKIAHKFKNFFNFIQTDADNKQIQHELIPQPPEKRASSTPDLFKLFESTDNADSNSFLAKK